VHGANRLASNSLLEGLVFGERIAKALAEDVTSLLRPTHPDRPPGPRDALPADGSALLEPGVRGDIQRIMTAYAGVLRGGDGMARAARELASLASRTTDEPCAEAWEATNLHCVASLIVAAALRREETRGSHWREDFPGADDAWRGHLVSTLTDGAITTTYEPLR
jgi:L-aspartate oxidase